MTHTPSDDWTHTITREATGETMRIRVREAAVYFESGTDGYDFYAGSLSEWIEEGWTVESRPAPLSREQFAALEIGAHFRISTEPITSEFVKVTESAFVLLGGPGYMIDPDIVRLDALLTEVPR